MANRYRESGRPDVANEQLSQMLDDDAFLTDLSLGIDTTDGHDPLAEMLLALREEVSAKAPLPPTLAELGIAPSDNNAPAHDGAADDMAPVVSLRSRRPIIGRFASGLIGAAAATLAIAGGGAFVSGADPDSPLYAVRQALFSRPENSDNATVVELATTLEQLNTHTRSGDVAVTQQLLQQAQRLVGKLHEAPTQQKPQKIVVPTTVTVTQTQAPETVVSTVTVTPEPRVTTVAVPVAPAQTPAVQTPAAQTPAAQTPSSSSPVQTPAAQPQPARNQAEQPSAATDEAPLRVPEEFRNQ
ncbi:hypothetical protein [Corynebacterium sp. HS2168-gen11]|uniref:hypothetical protein n=1 Tax=Corynebacterium sp. HS2168-gen11 TaxID=2974027 RepID=UPI00216AF599|nr:hypothetical protein [Corynebacterium sp. HS2168-gen11]MCS4535632.1 hypothetical protein [Corynebacterium sp. HS2168-gen11]